MAFAAVTEAGKVLTWGAPAQGGTSIGSARPNGGATWRDRYKKDEQKRVDRAIGKSPWPAATRMIL